MTSENDIQPVVQVPPQVLKRHLDDGTSLALLDVREEFERDICRIDAPESAVDVFIPLGELPTRLDELEDLTKSLPLIVYCHHGVRSLVAARWLASRGFQCGNLTGGIDAWAKDVDPTMRKY